MLGSHGKASMTDAEVSLICNSSALTEFYVPGAKIQWLDDLERAVLAEVPALAHCDPVEFRMLVAMAALGPRNAGVPPEAMRDHLMRIIRRNTPRAGRLARVEEFVIAYGCGKWRHTPLGVAAKWEDTWAHARDALGRMFRPSVEAARTWLHGTVTGFVGPDPENAEEVKEENKDIKADSAELAGWFIEPATEHSAFGGRARVTITGTMGGADIAWNLQPPDSYATGIKVVFVVPRRSRWTREGTTVVLGHVKAIVSVLDDETRIETGVMERVTLKIGETLAIEASREIDEWLCPCGTIRCEERHCLDSWPVRRIDLISHIASAVKGPPAAGTRVGRAYPPSPGGFVQGCTTGCRRRKSIAQVPCEPWSPSGMFAMRAATNITEAPATPSSRVARSATSPLIEGDRDGPRVFG
jgi:hypothetical protein